jgi:hypothetical protein
MLAASAILFRRSDIAPEACRSLQSVQAVISSREPELARPPHLSRTRDTVDAGVQQMRGGSAGEEAV